MIPEEPAASFQILKVGEISRIKLEVQKLISVRGEDEANHYY